MSLSNSAVDKMRRASVPQQLPGPEHKTAAGQQSGQDTAQEAGGIAGGEAGLGPMREQCAGRVPFRRRNSAKMTNMLKSVEQELQLKSSFNMAVRRESVPGREAPDKLRRSKSKKFTDSSLDKPAMESQQLPDTDSVSQTPKRAFVLSPRVDQCRKTCDI